MVFNGMPVGNSIPFWCWRAWSTEQCCSKDHHGDCFCTFYSICSIYYLGNIIQAPCWCAFRHTDCLHFWAQWLTDKEQRWSHRALPGQSILASAEWGSKYRLAEVFPDGSSSALLTSSPLALFLLLISNPRPSGKNQVSALVSWAADILSPEVKVSYSSSKFLPFWSLNSTTILNCSRHWWNRMTLQLARKKLVEVHQTEHTVCLLCYCFVVVEIIHRQCQSHPIQY